MTTCVAASETPHPVWTAFLERVAPDPELRAFLQRFCGYCCTGVTTEHEFVFAYGTGANGKSTFINTIAAILGDYATVAECRHLHRLQHRATPYRSGQAARRPPGRRAGDPERPALGRDQDQGA